MTKLFLIALLLVIGGSTISGKTSFFLSSNNASARTIVTDPKMAGKLTRHNFEDSVQSLYKTIGLEKIGMRYDVFRYGLIGFQTMKREGKLNGKNVVSFIDFTKPSTEKRFYTVDLDNLIVKFHSLVSHGKTTGENIAKSFSNIPHSNSSSLGFYITGETYVGSKGYSLRLDGVDLNYNDKMRERAVVMHAADYVSDSWIKRYGRLGRSQGCPALPNELNRTVIDYIKDKTVIFAFYDDTHYLKTSAHLKLANLFDKFDALAAR